MGTSDRKRWGARLLWLAAALVLCLAVADDAAAIVTTSTPAATNDDGEQDQDDGSMDRTSSDLELVSEGGEHQLVGVRFNNVAVPQGSTVCSAYLEFVANQVTWGYDPASLVIQAEDHDDAPGIGTGNSNLSNRTRTTASVPWTPAEWTVVNQVHQTPDIGAVVQELVNRGGWQTSSEALFLIEGGGTRHAYSRNGNAGLAPLIHVEYDSGAGCGAPTILERRVSNNNDDAEEQLRTGNISRGSGTLELAENDDQKQLVGIRFPNLTVPQGVTINSATIDFQVDEVDRDPTSLRFWAEDIDNAPQFGGGAFDIRNRTRTTASMDWNNIPSWTTVGSTQTSPDLAAVIQEVVNRAGWAGGNALVVVIDGTGERTAESFNGSGGPVLRIDYSGPPGTADLSITKADLPDPVRVGDVVSYVLTVTNGGPADATNVTVVDTLPGSVTFVSAVPTQGTCAGTGPVTCSLGTILNGGTAQVVISAATTVVGTITNNATVVATEPDPSAGNNAAAENTTVFSGTSSICYVVADAGGGPPGNDLLERVDTLTGTITPIGTGTNTNNIEAATYNSATGVLYAANAGQLGTLNLSTGAFTALPNPFGVGNGPAGAINMTDVDALAYDSTTGILYGAHRFGGGDPMFQINMATGQIVLGAFNGGADDYVIVPPILGLGDLDDIAVDPTTGQMYGIMNASVNDRLVTINKFTGASGDLGRVLLGGVGLNDIEGLGVDGTGQLWATTGSNEALYQINKATAVATTSVLLVNGQDYESVDCFSFSSLVTSDLAMGKTVDDATPGEGDTVTYTVTVTNNGPNFATAIQVLDVLPAGVTFSSATPSQGIYNAGVGRWFVGNLVSTGSATLTLAVTVDLGTAGSTITNTTSVEFLSQVDPDATNDTASVDIVVQGAPDLVVAKMVLTLEDPFNGTTDPKAIPGATVQYTLQVTNTGTGSVDNDSMIVTDPLPANTALLMDDFDGSNPGPVAFVDGAPVSGLSYSYVAPGDITDDIEFSDDGGATWTYVPTAPGTDANVTHIRINPKGTLGFGAGNRAFQLLFKVVVQ